MPDKLITAGVKHMKFWHRAGKSMARSILIRIYLKMVQNVLSLIQRIQVTLIIVIPSVVLVKYYFYDFLYILAIRLQDNSIFWHATCVSVRFWKLYFYCLYKL